MKNRDRETPSADEVRDALCELVNIGNGNALTALNRLLDGVALDLEVPEYTTGGLASAMAGLEENGVLISMAVSQPLHAVFMTALDGGSAAKLAGVLVPKSDQQDRRAEHESALLEAVNILACGFLNAVGSMLGSVMVPTPPQAEYGRLGDLVDYQFGDLEGLVALSSRFSHRSGKIRGRNILMADGPAVRRILVGMGVDI